jgi:hypothetical protein
MTMILKGKKCICKKCDDCNFSMTWDMAQSVNGLPTGLTERITKCGFMVLFEEIPKIRGAIDGLQGGVNDARNKSFEARETIGAFIGHIKQAAAVKAIGNS